jgi:hypothetical protein
LVYFRTDENKNSGSPTTNNSNQPRPTWAGLNTAEEGRDNIMLIYLIKVKVYMMCSMP